MACYSSRGKKKSLFILNSVVCHFKKLDIVVQYFACEVADASSNCRWHLHLELMKEMV